MHAPVSNTPEDLNDELARRPVTVRLRGVSKAYRIWSAPDARLKVPMVRWFARLFPKRSALRASLEKRAALSYRDFHALKGIDLEIRKGESVGIIGRNGSGKSTLLQIIAGTLQPSEGTVEIHGRIAALLELGSGFNPEFTGRENVHLNAAILGLTRSETDAVMDDILAFADIGDFIDQPVKTYSSGMMVRLAFAVQVQVNPDLLIVDEALAVGDALFQKRCFQRIEQLIANGTTILFVSHDQESVRTLTHRALFLNAGTARATGPSSEVILEYRRFLHEEERAYFQGMTEQLAQRAAATRAKERERQIAPLAGRTNLAFGDLDAEIVATKVLDASGAQKNVFFPGELICVRVCYKIHRNVRHVSFGFRLRNREGVKIYSWGTRNKDVSIWAGLASGEVVWEREFHAGTTVEVTFAFTNLLGSNLYEVQAAIDESETKDATTSRMVHWRDEAAFFQSTLNPREYVFNGVVDLGAVASVQEVK